jgi:hypothetical protein
MNIYFLRQAIKAKLKSRLRRKYVWLQHLKQSLPMPQRAIIFSGFEEVGIADIPWVGARMPPSEK